MYSDLKLERLDTLVRVLAELASDETAKKETEQLLRVALDNMSAD
jgi:hypothetical protein